MNNFEKPPIDDIQTSIKPRAKSREETLREREILSQTYRNIHNEWENNKGRYGIPMLDENFVLVRWLRSGFQSNEAPLDYFEYINNYGYIRINIWHIDKKRKRMIVNEEMYTLGPDGKTRGKGRQGLQGTHRILQSITDSTDYSVYDIATPNEASAPLLTEAEGYRPFTSTDEETLAPVCDDRDRVRWNKMVASAKPFPSMIKCYTPSPKQLNLNEREIKEIDIILDVTLLERKQ